MDYFLEKLPFPPWGASVPQRIEMTINSFYDSKSLGNWCDGL